MTCIDRDGDGYGTGQLANLVTTSSTAVSAVGQATITLGATTGLQVGYFIRYDPGPNMEVVAITAINGNNVTASFGATHSSGASVSAGVTSHPELAPGCLGPDADDLDPAVHTGAQALAKWGSMQAFLAHLGYTPARIWLLSTTGSDTTGTSCTPAQFETACVGHERLTPGVLAADDLIMLRNGYGIYYTPIQSGTQGHPIIWMSYPGERATFNLASSQSLNVQGKSWWIVDGITVIGDRVLGGGDNSYTENPHTFHDNAFRHIDASGGQEAMGPWSGGDRITIEDSVFHDCPSEAGLYIGATYITDTGWIVRRNISYNNSWDGIHWNGRGTGLLFEQNVSYYNGLVGMSFQSGMMNSTVRNNLSFGNASFAMSIYNYKDEDVSCGGPCGGPQTGNLFQNNTLVHIDDAGMPYHTNGCFAVNNGSNPPSFSLGNNRFRNNVCVSWGDASSTQVAAPFAFYGGTNAYNTANLATSTFDHNLTWQYSGINGGTTVFGVLPPLGGLSQDVYTCANAPMTTGAATNCIASDPRFVAASMSYWSTPGRYDLHLTSNSPALHAGTATGVPPYDLFGNPFAGTPSMGAIELAGAPPPSPPTVSISAPAGGSTVSGSVTASATATASGSLSVTGVQFQVDGTNLGSAVTAGPAYSTRWDTTQTANGLHTLTAIATDSGGRSGSASVSVTINNVSSGPVISGVTAGSITSSAATITWTTDRASASQVNYGPTAAYGLTSGLAASLVTSHVVALSGLSASTTYHFAVLSRDGSGNLSTSGDFTFSTAGSSSLGWTDLANTRLKDVCPANSFNGIAYNFADRCDAVVAAWSSAVADTKRNRLIIWGGGHTDYSGNEVYSLNLGAVPPTLTRLTDPSDFTQNGSGCPDTNVVDGTPVSRHTYDGLVYLPVQDKMFSFAGGLAPCGGPWSDRTYTLDLSQPVPTWKAMDPINGYQIGYQETTAICGYDPNSLTVICNSTGTFFRYDPATNTNTQLSTGQYPPYSATGVIDPKRKLFIFMGTDYLSTTPRVVAVDISPGSSFNVQEWSSLVTGCDALAGANYPGLAYDPVLDRIVGWPNAGNTIYVFNADLKTCTAQTFPNGPTNTLASTTGTAGRFQYFPGLNAYGVVSLATLDAFKLTLGTTPPAPIPCDVNSDGLVNAADVPAAINQVLGITPCGTAALRQPGQCTVVDVQRVINTVYTGATCKTGN
jgi:hypothetical protein